MATEITKEQSEIHAMLIESIKPALKLMDTEFLLEAGKVIRSKASRYDAMAPAIRSYTPAKTKILDEEATSLELLAQFILCLKRCDHYKRALSEEVEVRRTIEDLF